MAASGGGSGYDSSFYEFTGDAARGSAEEIVPLLLAISVVGSVVDVGCGVGTWLAVFQRHQVDDVLGFDGPHVDRTMLEIPGDRFRAWDLEQRLPLDRTFDLACCLEVAEHLSEHRADTLVDDLARLAPIVLFSAAVPLQGGVAHINEQWPTYWVEKFAKRGLVVIDAIRPEIWDNDRVAMWYSQNCLLFATDDAIRAHPRLAEARAATDLTQLNVVHPSFWLFYRLSVTERIYRMPMDAVTQQKSVEPEDPTPSVVASESVPPPGLRALVPRGWP
jgi:SAM-dependent methyltransferase